MTEETKQEKSKFVQNEIVLCYEPDPLKAKMLYEAKVNMIRINVEELLFGFQVTFREKFKVVIL